jgi:hypothetical protein
LTSLCKFINCSKQLKYSPKVYVIILQFLGAENGNSRRNEPDIFCQCRPAVLARIRKLGVRIGHFWAMVTDEYPLGARDGCIFSAIPLSLGIVCILKTTLKKSVIIQEENTKKNNKRVVSLYVIKNHVNLHKL